MIHHASPEFWECYRNLPPSIRGVADRAFALLKEDLYHPSLHFKKVEDMWSVRVGGHYRALAVSVQEGVLWVWIGSHAEYDRLVR